MKITIIQHVSFEVPGLIDEWIKTHHYQCQIIKLFENGYHLPSPETVDFLIVMVRPMSANDQLPWIQAERMLIRQVVTAGKPMLGVCLGGQQLAKAFGATIVPTTKEVGFGPVITSALARTRLTTKPKYQVLHWHGEGFTMPSNSEGLFSSPNWPNQGFQLGSAIGLQFHLESTPATLGELVNVDSDFINGSVLRESPSQILQTKFDPNCKVLLFHILDYLSHFNYNNE
ncbi:type 1 glutamine amidotransferase [Lentilactobacillus kisonensis]|uniref:Class I glutamine amidotransferase n=2 Tax=Lentilactobacillus kisonensis TaxID=481722 RepID=H1LE61_9LACO|nr:type 1 glutamine amidotransferase [Lentilactobacillus kisonensis]EHO52619.1 class I glutamine amidotransferase [Lentilactobacillus kisonensis F0435]